MVAIFFGLSAGDPISVFISYGGFEVYKQLLLKG